MPFQRVFYSVPGFLAIVSLTLGVSAPAQNLQETYRTLTLTLPPFPVQRSMGVVGNPKIAPALRDLQNPGATRGLGEPPATPVEAGVVTRSGRLAVVVECRAVADLDAVRALIAAQGGEAVAAVDRSILARVPAAALDPLARNAAVLFVTPQEIATQPAPHPGTETRGALVDGLTVTKVRLLHQKGLTGRGVRIGIIDFGYTGYKALQAQGVLPAPAALKSFSEDGGWDRVTTGSTHGTGCAEIIHAVAPDAQLVIASMGDGSGRAASDEVFKALEWLMTQNVDLISYSGGTHAVAHNGKALQDKLVEAITARGILLVAAAGNEGDAHWSGMSQLTPEGILQIGAKPYMLLAGNGAMRVHMFWDDWGPDPVHPTATQDFDASVMRIDPQTKKPTVVAVGNEVQNGRGAPREQMQFKAEKDVLYVLVIKGTRVDRPVRVHVLVDGGEMAPTSPEGSVGIPAANPLALAVGAVNVDNAKLEPFSSQGPTDDGRAKPDVSAPDNVVVNAYKEGFTGTSAACPFAAGFAALVRQQYGKTTPAELMRLIVASTTPLADNRGAGRGMIDASKLAGMGSTAPAPVSSAPKPGPAPPPTPAAPGVSVNARLAQLAAEANTQNPLGVKIAVGHPEYHVGDGLKVGFRAPRDASCVVVRKSVAGQFTPVHPARTAELRVAGGTSYVFPAADPQTLRVAGPPGQEQMLLICSDTALRLETIVSVDPGTLSVSSVAYNVQ